MVRCMFILYMGPVYYGGDYFFLCTDSQVSCDLKQEREFIGKLFQDVNQLSLNLFELVLYSLYLSFNSNILLAFLKFLELWQQLLNLLHISV